MERLTQSNFNYCKEYCAEADGCAYAKGVIPDMCGDAAQYYRLAAYEDTGLTPEEAKYFGRLVRGERMVTEADLMESGVSQEEIQRLKDVITAEAEGRLLVLPCKIGDTVYWLRGTAILPVYIEWFETNVDGWCACGKYPPMAAPTFKFADFGKTVFLTREEAEAALNSEGTTRNGKGKTK